MIGRSGIGLYKIFEFLEPHFSHRAARTRLQGPGCKSAGKACGTQSPGAIARHEMKGVWGRGLPSPRQGRANSDALSLRPINSPADLVRPFCAE